MITAIEENEIIVNNRQRKTDDDFYTSLSQMFQQCARVLKLNRHMVLTFNYTQLGIRNPYTEQPHYQAFKLKESFGRKVPVQHKERHGKRGLL